MLDQKIQQAANLLHQGKLIVFPTETVYGLGCDATHIAAIQKIYQIKKRPSHRPLSILLASFNQISDWISFCPPLAWQLANHFWPGPMTLVFPKAEKVSTILTGGENTIGIRIPAHPMALSLLRVFGQGIATPSANLSGHKSPIDLTQVEQSIIGQCDMGLNGGKCQIGVESTLVSFAKNEPEILREGAIGEQIREFIKLYSKTNEF